MDFFDIKRATTSLLNPHNHYLNGRSLKVEYASAEAVRRGGNKQQKMLKPGTFKKGKRNFEETKSAEPPKPLEEIKLLSKEELEAPEAKKQHKPTKEERQAAREQRKKEQKSNSSHTRRPHQQSSAAVGSKGSKVVFDE